MRRANMVTVALVALLLDMTGTQLATAQPKGERQTIRGEAVDLWCHLEAGDRGPAKKACATACAKAGNPIGILDAEGNLYIVAGLDDHQPAQALLVEHMSQVVTVSGILVRKGGVQMIYIDSVK